MKVKIYHNPKCTKSRLTLELLRENGIEPEVIEYLKNPPGIPELTNMVKLLGIPARGLLRTSEAAYKENNLSDSSVSEAHIIKIMHENPILIERPVVIVNNQKAAIGRPPENVLEILD